MTKLILSEEFKRMQKLAGILNENEVENAKPSYITIGFYNQDKFMNQYKTGNEFTYHANGLAEGNYRKLLNGKLELENGYYYPIFRCITDLKKFRESRYRESRYTEGFTEGFYIIYLSYFKESNVVSILSSNTHIDMTGNNNQDKFKSLADATNWNTEFEKLEAGEVDDRGYFKIISVK
jgi:hypothetical protein